jgi:ribosomal subunit interface protein
MPFRVSGKNLDVGDALRARINARVAEAAAKYFDGGFSGHVTLSRDGFGFRTECVIHLDSGVVLEADGFAADAYTSADQAALRMEKRLRRYKRRLKGRPGALKQRD